MEFINGKCPGCGGELQIPKEHDEIICMYCGNKIKAKEAVDRLEREISRKERLGQGGKFAYDSTLELVKAGMASMLFEMEKPMASFSRKTYAGNFEAYEKKYQEVLDSIEDVLEMSREPEALQRSLAKEFAAAAADSLDALSKKRHREDKLLDYNMTMVVFFFPALQKHNTKSGEALAKAIAEEWKEQFPEANIEPATFERINGGFRRRFCYITTAVCESLGKPDDCYELNVLRIYRDQYLMKQENGEELIARYYDVAPTIVKRISRKKNSGEIYQGIWKKYLLPCIGLIEQDKLPECQKIYQSMVYDLQEQYFS